MSFALPDRARPMSDLNTTPLIDILLVLLVMLIFTLPPPTNTLDFPLPAPEREHRPVDPVRNVVAVTPADAVLWNGAEVSETELDALLHDAAALDPEPEVEIAADGRASYDETARVLRLVKLSGSTRVGFVGNERYRAFRD